MFYVTGSIGSCVLSIVNNSTAYLQQAVAQPPLKNNTSFFFAPELQAYFQTPFNSYGLRKGGC